MSGTTTGTCWGGGWTREEEKAFENGIAMHWRDGFAEQSWTKIASLVPSKSIQELKHHYQLLLDDIAAIEAGNVPLPNYNTAPARHGQEPSSSSMSTDSYKDHFRHKDNNNNKPFSNSNFSSHDSVSGQSGGGKGGGGSSRADQERRKGIPWTEEEHRYGVLLACNYFTINSFSIAFFARRKRPACLLLDDQPI